MAIYDMETFFDELKAFLQANINTKITEINTEKGDSLLGSINNAAYIFQTLDSSVANYDPFIFYGFEIKEQQAEMGFSAKILQVEVTVIMSSDPDEDDAEVKRLLRYSRVLQELFEKNWNQINKRVKLKVSSLEPIAFKLANSSELFRAVGVYLELSLP